MLRLSVNTIGPDVPSAFGRGDHPDGGRNRSQRFHPNLGSEKENYQAAAVAGRSAASLRVSRSCAVSAPRLVSFPWRTKLQDPASVSD